MSEDKVLAQSGRVTTEGDTLFYEVRGSGKPLLMITPAGGDGWGYAGVAEILADEYQVITFDRRANGRSTINAPQNFEISQQSRDAAAVLKAVGVDSAFVFGNSSGAVIALELAKTQPQAVRGAIIHEAPLPRMLADPKKWQRFFAKVYLTSFWMGPAMAAVRFMLGAQLPFMEMIKSTGVLTTHIAESPDPYIDNMTATEVLIRLELLPVTNYLPDAEIIKKNGVKIVIALGAWAIAKNTWYVQADQNLAEQLGCEVVDFPGHHGSFIDQPEEFAAALRTTLHEMED